MPTITVQKSPYWATIPAARPEDLAPGLRCRLLTLEDVGIVKNMRHEVLTALENPDYYRPAREAPDFVERHLAGRGLTMGVFDGDRLVAFGALGLPQPGDHNRGETVPLPPSELNQVADMASGMVAPGYRGRGLHHWLIRWRVSEAVAQGRRHLVTHSSLNNHVSWQHLAVYGLFAKRLLHVSDEIKRFVIHRDVRQSVTFDPSSCVTAGIADIARLDELMQSGLWVMDKTRDESGWAAVLAKPIIA